MPLEAQEGPSAAGPPDWNLGRGAGPDVTWVAELAADCLWALDAQLRFRQVHELRDARAAATSGTWIGRCPWAMELAVAEEGGAAALRSRLEERRTIRRMRVHHAVSGGERRHLELNAVPCFDDRGGFTGYRGIARDVSGGQRIAQDLQQREVILDASPDLIFAVDPEHMRFLYVNDTACKMSGYSREEFLHLSPAAVSGASHDELREIYAEVLRRGEDGLVTEHIGVGKDGSRGWFESRRRALRLDNRWIIVTISRDTTQRRLAEESVARMRQMYAALSVTNEAIMHARSREELFRRVCAGIVESGEVTDAMLLCSAAPQTPLKVEAVTATRAATLPEIGLEFDATAAELPDLVRHALRSGETAITTDLGAGEAASAWHAMAQRSGLRGAAAVPFGHDGPAGAGVLVMFSPRRRTFDEETAELLERVGANLTFALDNFRREAERREAEARVEHLATHDPLTDLPNRRMFGGLLDHAIETAYRHGRRLAVLFVDLDGFKAINDSLGHEAGDALLIETAARFREILRASDVVARLGGDEFVVLLQEVTDRAQIESVARRLIETASRPVTFAEEERRIGASVGIAVYPADGRDGASLTTAADRAMYRAKRAGKHRFSFSGAS